VSCRKSRKLECNSRERVPAYLRLKTASMPLASLSTNHDLNFLRAARKEDNGRHYNHDHHPRGTGEGSLPLAGCEDRGWVRTGQGGLVLDLQFAKHRL
jgi:hypothetical protein